MTEFTPYSSLAGGALIGLSAIILMIFAGKIAGVSGIVSRMLPPSSNVSDFTTGLFFMIGVFLALPLYHLITNGLPTITLSPNLPMLAVAGLCVGLGTVIGNGCTSGHGVCGISRLSGRSIVATLIFMITALITVFYLRNF